MYTDLLLFSTAILHQPYTEALHMPVYVLIKLFEKGGKIIDKLMSGGKPKTMYEGLKKESALATILEARKEKLREKNKMEQLNNE